MNKKATPKKRPVVTSNYAALAICAVFALFLAFFFIVSLFDKTEEISQKENRTLKQRPKFSVSAVFNGSYHEEFDEYYTDQFPFRDKLLGLNEHIQDLFSQKSSGDDGMVIFEKSDKDDFAGQSID